MKIQGMKNPGIYTIESVPMTDNVLIRMYLNPIETEDGLWEYEEYKLEVPKTNTIEYEVENNMQVFLEEAKKRDPELLAEQAKEAELAKQQLRADIDFIAVMTGVEL